MWVGAALDGEIRGLKKVDRVEMPSQGVNPSSPGELATRIRYDIRKWSKLVLKLYLVAVCKVQALTDARWR
jgi:hypothetical protein